METPVKQAQLPQKLQKLLQPLGKYKYAAAILLVGVVLMLWPQSEKNEVVSVSASCQEEQMVSQVQQRLETLLSNVEGAGRVQLMLSLQTGTEYEYQSDADADRTQTALAQESGNVKTPIVRKSHYPVYRGAVIVCEGADSASVRLSIIDAVCSLTGLGSDKVSVIKMKKQ